MDSKPIIKLYGENHATDNLLEMYDEIFALAQKEGCTTCFFEHEPFWQEERDEFIKEISKYNKEKFQSSKANIIKAYEGRFGSRGDGASVYLAYLAAETGINLINVDVAPHPVRMVLRNEAQDLHHTDCFQAIKDTFAKIKLASESDKGWWAANVGLLTGRQGWDSANLKHTFMEIESELSDKNLFLDKLQQDVEKRLSGDVLVSEFILSRLDGHPAIAIYGKFHIDHERSDSIASVLAASEKIRTYAFHIVKDKIVPRPGEIRKVGSEILPLEDIKEDPQIQNARGMAFDARHIIHTEAGLIGADQTEARWWYMKAAKQGSAEAQYNLAQLYYDNFSGIMDNGKAFLWTSKAAEAGHSGAWALLGELYYKGRGVAKDDEQSAVWYEKAAKAGNIFAQSVTGYNYHKGAGVKKNLVLAYMWYFVAAQQNDKDAIKNMALAEKTLPPYQVLQAKEMAQKHLP